MREADYSESISKVSTLIFLINARVALPSYAILIGENGQDVRFSALGQGRPYARRVIDIA